jgi:hypothetical protein
MDGNLQPWKFELKRKEWSEEKPFRSFVRHAEGLDEKLVFCPVTESDLVIQTVPAAASTKGVRTSLLLQNIELCSTQKNL